MMIYCTDAGEQVNARLTNGAEVYPHREDLKDLPFWICDDCHNFVGCHYKTNKPTTPLGVIASQNIKNARMKIHAILDPLWKKEKISRSQIYSRISKELGHQYHTANIMSIDEARKIYIIVAKLHNELLEK